MEKPTIAIIGPGRAGSALGRALHRPAFMAVPRVALGIALGRQLVDEALLASQRVLPARLVASSYQFRHTTLDAALVDVLGAQR